MSAASFPNAFFQTNLRLELQAGLDVGTKVLNLAGIVVVRALDLGFYGVVGSFVLVNTIICIVAFLVSRRFWRINLDIEWKRARVLMRDAFGIGVVSMIGLLHFKGDAILLSLFRPAKDVGIYAVAYRFIDQAFFLPGVFMAAVFPVLTRSIHRNPRDGETTINHAFRVLVLGAVAVTVLIVVAAAPLVRLVSNREFDQAIEPLRILAFAVPAIFVGPVFYNAVIAVNKQRDLIVISVISLVFNVLLNVILIPRYSYNGAAIATVVTEVFSCSASFAIAKRWIPFELDPAFLIRAAAATAAAAGAAAVAWRASSWLALAAAEAVFVVSAYAVGAITRSDVEVMFGRASAP
jgi:O-antigen/teichoic acid export membrane protein